MSAQDSSWAASQRFSTLKASLQTPFRAASGVLWHTLAKQEDMAVARRQNREQQHSQRQGANSKNQRQLRRLAGCWLDYEILMEFAVRGRSKQRPYRVF
jgi:hypothetical protein